jgi:arylsulfatase
MASERPEKFAIALILASLPLPVFAAETISDEIVRPVMHQGFVGPTVTESSPARWPPLTRPPAPAPNVILIMTDDVGFGASSTFGGPVPTPTFDSLAEQGLRFNRFHTTAMCSPTRAALLTGRNHTQVGMGTVTDRATGYDGYTTVIPKNAATIAELLRSHGYSTAAFGKWHLAPLWETGPNGPFDHWPTQMGFEHFYGFMTGDTDQWAPTLYQDQSPIEPPADDPDYILDRALADNAIRWIRERKSTAPEKPFFLYFVPGTPHAPHQAPAEWIDRFRGQFDQGWDEVRKETIARQENLGVIPADTRLTARPDEIPAWASLTSDQRKVYARKMEAFAGTLAFADEQIGRVIQAVRDIGQIDNTLVIYIQGDNGSSGEGGLTGAFNETSILNGLTEDVQESVRKLDLFGTRYAHSNYPAGWGWAMGSPFQWMKVLASHFGGTQTGMVMSWPERIRDAGGLRSQFHHVVDIMPTIIEAARVSMPPFMNGVTQRPLEGIPMQYAWDDADAPSRRRTQFFTIYDNLAIYHDGWVAATTPVTFPWELVSNKPAMVRGRNWELYDVHSDFSQSVDLAQRYPDKLAALQELFWAEAARNDALPIHRGEGSEGKPSWIGSQRSFSFYPGTRRLLTANAPPTVNRSFSIKAQVDLSNGEPDGMLVTHGGRTGGFGFYILDGKLVFHYNLASMRQFEIVSASTIDIGADELEAEFSYDGGGTGKGATVTLKQDGNIIGKGRVDQTLPRFYGLDAMFDVGIDTGSPVAESYAVPFRSGVLKKLQFDVSEHTN